MTGPSAIDVCAFLIPAMSFLEIVVVGRLIISEVVGLALLPLLLRVPDRLRIPRWLLVLWGLWLISQVVTDLVVGSAFSDWARGWAAIVFTLVDLLVICSLAATPRRARIFAVGLAIGASLGYFVSPFATAPIDIWKWAGAYPCGLLLGAGLSGAIWLRRPWIAVVAFAAFGWLNAALLFRSLGGVALLSAVYLLATAILQTERRPQLSSIGRAIGALAAFAVAGVAIFLAINLASSMGLLGGAATARYEEQAGVPATTPEAAPPASAGPSVGTTGSTPPPATPPPAVPSNPFALLITGRAELLASPWAIIDSPILGHGSWAKDPKYATLQIKGLDDRGLSGVAQLVDPNLIPTHSYLLGSWVWAGFAGALFWFGVLALSLWLIANLYRVRVAIAPLIIFTTILLLWNIAFSPYGNSQRIDAAFAIAMVLLGLRLVGPSQTPVVADSPAPVPIQPVDQSAAPG